jgi:enoyl-[acyl-carrier-protein] reductase (NADH)
MAAAFSDKTELKGNYSRTHSRRISVSYNDHLLLLPSYRDGEASSEAHALVAAQLSNCSLMAALDPGRAQLTTSWGIATAALDSSVRYLAADYGRGKYE